MDNTTYYQLTENTNFLTQNGKINKSLLFCNSHILAKHFTTTCNKSYTKCLAGALSIIYIVIGSQQREYSHQQIMNKQNEKELFNIKQNEKRDTLRTTIYIEFLTTIKDNTKFRNEKNRTLYTKVIDQLTKNKKSNLSLIYGLLTAYQHSKYNRSSIEMTSFKTKIYDNKYNVKNIYELDIYIDNQFRLKY